MNFKSILASVGIVTLLLGTTGCFRVSSDTRALRDAALEFGPKHAEEKIEFGVGYFTVGLARLGTRFVDLPPEARSILGAVKNAECSVYEIKGSMRDAARLLAEADRSMQRRGSERIVGVIDREQFVAVYVPTNVRSLENMKMSIMVLTKNELVCATARGDLQPLVELAYSKAAEHLPPKSAHADAL